MAIALTVVGAAKLKGFTIVSINFDDRSEKMQSDLFSLLHRDTSGNIDSLYIINDTSARIIKFMVKEELMPQDLEKALGITFSSINVDSSSYEPPADQKFSSILSTAAAKQQYRARM